jgi:hypothetical protein
LLLSSSQSVRLFKDDLSNLTKANATTNATILSELKLNSTKTALNTPEEVEKPPTDQGLVSIDQVHIDINKRLDE